LLDLTKSRLKEGRTLMKEQDFIKDLREALDIKTHIFSLIFGDSINYVSH